MKTHRIIKNDDPLGKEHIIFGDDDGTYELKRRLTTSLKGYLYIPNGENKNEENNNDMKPKKKVSRRDVFKSNIQDILEKVSEKSSYDAKKQQKETKKDWLGRDKKIYESTSNNSRIKEEFLYGINKMKKDGETTCYTTTLPDLYTIYDVNNDGVELTGFSSMTDSSPGIRERLIFYDDVAEGEDGEKIERE